MRRSHFCDDQLFHIISEFYAVCGGFCYCRGKFFKVGGGAFLTIELCLHHIHHHMPDCCDRWLFGSVGDYADQLVESVLVDRSEIRSVCRSEDGFCDVVPHDHRDLLRYCLLKSNCCQAGRVFSVYLVLGVGVGCDLWRDDPVYPAGCGGIGDRMFLVVALLYHDFGFVFYQQIKDLAANPDNSIR